VAKLVFRTGQYSGKRVTLPVGKTVTMGRNRDLELPLPDLKLSRRHCQIISKGPGYLIKDLGSTNGTFVNGTRIANETELHDFDRVVLGDTELEFLEEMQRTAPVSAEAYKTPVAPPNVEMRPSGRQPAQPLQPEESFEIMEELVEEPAQQQAKPASGELIIEDMPVVDDAQVVVIPAPAPAGQASGRQALPGTGKSAAVPAMDPLEMALRELATPLPPEPPVAPLKAQLTFCDGCDGSIPAAQLESGEAQLIDGKNYCKECLAKSARAAGAAPVQHESNPQVVAGRATQPAIAQARPRPVETTRSVDDMLAGLDDEAVVVDTTLKRRGQVVAEDDVSNAMKQMDTAQQQLISRRNPPAPSVIPAPNNIPAPRAQPPSNNADLLADEFEELN
jgi:pSer/pThr/pTyr-binding forkhead associated (FHA) protein